MTTWERIILEWINCLNVVEIGVKSLEELRNGKIYAKIINLFGTRKTKDGNLTNDELVLHFIKDEYPDFHSSGDEKHITDIEISSLLLARSSEEAAFHRPMCAKLQHETQVKIKSFLELILPMGRGLTRSAMRSALSELMDPTPRTPPVTPKNRPLKDFFNSPVALSARSYRVMSDKNLEVRRLKSELETERFEKADLQEDLKMQQDKIAKLQRQLEEKSDAIKSLKAERMKPRTPQSCKKFGGSRELEETLRKEIKSLEEYSAGLQMEIETLQTEKEGLHKNMLTMQRHCTGLRDKSETLERSVEQLMAQVEVKDKELVDLRMDNEELRSHVKELKRPTIDEQSFEFEHVIVPQSPMAVLNTSEALSSVIEIQLQEAKVESQNLMVNLQNSMEKIEALSAKCRDYEAENEALTAKAELLVVAQGQLAQLNDKLASLNKDFDNLEEKHSELIENCSDLEQLVASKNDAIGKLESSKNALKDDFDNLKSELNKVKDSLSLEREKSSNLESLLAESEGKLRESADNVQSLMANKENLEGMIENYHRSVKQSLQQSFDLLGRNIENVDGLSISEAMRRFREVISSLKDTEEAQRTTIGVLHGDIGELKCKISKMTRDIETLEASREANLSEISTLNESIKEARATISSLEGKVSRLSEDRDVSEKEKESLTATINDLSETLKSKDDQLTSLQMQVQQLEEDIVFRQHKMDSIQEELSQKLEEQKSLHTNYVNKATEVLEQKTRELDELNVKNNRLDSDLRSLEQTLNASEKERSSLHENLTSAREEISNLGKTIEDLNASIVSLEQVKSKLEDDYANLQRDYEEYEIKMQSLQEQQNNNIDVLSGERDKLSSNLDKLSLEKVQVEQQLACVQRELEDVQSINKSLERSLSENCGEVERLRQSVDQLEADRESEIKAKNKLQSTHDKLQERHQQLKAQMRESLEQMKRFREETTLENENLSKTLQNLSLNKGEIEAALGQVEESLRGVQAQNDTLNVKLSENERRREELLQQIEALESSLREKSEESSRNAELHQQSQRELESVQLANRTLQQSLSESANERQRLGECLEELKINHESEVKAKNDVQASLDTLQENHQSLTTKMRALEEQSKKIQEDMKLENENLSASLQSLSLTKEQVDGALKQLRQQFCEVQWDNGELCAKLSENEARRVELAEQIKSLESNLASKNEESIKYQDLHRQSQQDWIRLKSELSANAAKLEQENIEKRNNLLRDFDLLRAAGENVERELSAAREKISQVESSNAALESSLEDARATEQKLNEDVELLRGDLSQSSENYSQCKSQLEALEQRHKETLEAAQRTREEHSESIRRKCQEYEELQSILTTLGNEKDKILELLKIAEDNINNVRDEKTSLERKLMETTAERVALQEQVSQLDAKLQQSLDYTRTLEINHENLRKEGDEEAAQLKRNVKSLEETRVKLEEDLTSATDECKLLQEKLDASTSQISQQTSTIKSLQDELVNLTADREDLLAKTSEREKMSKELTDNLESRLLKSQSTYEQCKIDLKLKSEELEVLTARVEELAKQKIESELKMKEVIVNLQEVRKSQDEVLETQSKALQEKSTCLEELEERLSKCKESLTKELEDERAAKAELKGQYEILHEQNKGNEIVIEELQKKIAAMESEFLSLRDKYDLQVSENSEIARVCEELSRVASALKDSLKTCQVDYKDVKEEIDGECGQSVFATLKTAIVQMTIAGDAIVNLARTKDKFAEEQQLVKQQSERYQAVTQELERNQEAVRNNLNLLVSRKKSLEQPLCDTVVDGEQLDAELLKVTSKWNNLVSSYKTILTSDGSVCDEQKHLLAKKEEIEVTLSDLTQRRITNLLPLLKIFRDKFAMTESALQSDKAVWQIPVKQEIDTDTFSDELSSIDKVRAENCCVRRLMDELSRGIEEFANLAVSYEANLKSGQVKREPNAEEKLQSQIERLTKEKKDLKDKLDMTRTRLAKMERNMDDMRKENKVLKSSQESSQVTSVVEIESLKSEIECLKLENGKINQELREAKEEIEKRPSQEEFNKYKKSVHDEYEAKLDKLKQTIKTAYSDQKAKLLQEQESVIQERVRAKMEQQCRKYTEEINRYKAHISELSSQFWDVGDKLLKESQQKEVAEKELKKMQERQVQFEQRAATYLNGYNKSSSLDRRSFANDRFDSGRPSLRGIEVVEEEYARRRSVRSIQTMGNAFKAEDEEGEVFDNVYLEDLKRGTMPVTSDLDRLSVLQMRNSLCKPHLKSSYPAETQFHSLPFSEDDIKCGTMSSEDVFNDSLSQSLLPGQKIKKKDKNQTLYKRPGPPTPSKNGGRLSLQGNEMKSPSSRILKERNAERLTATPRRLKSLFGSSHSKKDENSSGTPKRRISNIFRKTRAAADKS